MASTSIELAMWRAFDPVGAPTNSHMGAFKDRPYATRFEHLTNAMVREILESEIFSMVRNPYARFVSAFEAKVRMHGSVADRLSENKLGPWERLRHQFGFTDRYEPPAMLEFLEALAKLDPFEVDHHFRPQHICLLHGVVPLDFLFRLEDLEQLRVFLGARGLSVGKDTTYPELIRPPPAETIGKHEAELIARYYASDFQVYGYDTDIRKTAPKHEVILNSGRGCLAGHIRRRPGL